MYGQQTHQQQQHHTDMPVGDILRRTRIYYGLTLNQVQEVLCIRKSYLEAIEAGNLSVLPGRTYAIGFVRTYAEYLQLDAERIVVLFKRQYVGNGNRPELHFPATATESKLPNKYIMGASVTAFIALIIGWSVIGNNTRQAVDYTMVPQVPESLKVDLASRAMVTPMPDTTVLNAIEPAVGEMAGILAKAEERKESPVVINVVNENVWLEIRKSDGKVLISQVLKPGDSYTVPQDEAGLVMDTGNAGALEISVGQEKLPKLGESGDILRDVALDPSSLKESFLMIEAEPIVAVSSSSKE